MRMWRTGGGALVSAALIADRGRRGAADFPEPKTSEYVIKDFTFHTGEVMPEMKVSYTTVGEPSGEPVLMLHGTTGSARSMLTEGFAGALYGPGQALDATKYFIIIPDAIGTGGSSKPSDGLRAAFPEYNYDDMVAAQYDLVKNHLGIDHLRLVMGNSMGGMLTWTWGVTHPDFMDALVPMASLPGPMSGRNWMMRRMLIDAVRTDPAWDGGNYKEQPPNLRHRQCLVLDRHQQRREAAGEDRQYARGGGRLRRQAARRGHGAGRQRRDVPVERLARLRSDRRPRQDQGGAPGDQFRG